MWLWISLRKVFSAESATTRFLRKNRSVYNLYNELSVTTDKVLSFLTIDDPSTMTKAKEIVFTYLKRYVRNLTEKELPSFMRFITGSATYSGEHIKVIFHSYTGNLPHVLLHTCSSMTLEYSLMKSKTTQNHGTFTQCKQIGQYVYWLYMLH